jgi:YbbR domain-containing protein
LFAPLRWLISNLGSLILAFLLALVVWVSAVTANDPNVERVRTVQLEIVGKDPNILLVGSVPSQVRVTFRAPRSIADIMATTDNAIRASVDLSGLAPGTQDVNVQVRVNENFRPVRLMQYTPEVVTLTLEPLETKRFTVKLLVEGDPADGYAKGTPVYNPTTVTVSGPQSLVSQVDQVSTTLNIAGASESISTELPPIALDANGQPVSGLTITPNAITITESITLQGGYRNVVVKVVTLGEVADGYKLTNISASPPNVVVFSTNPQLVNNLPNFVETTPLDLTGAQDDLDVRLPLNLPKGISAVGDQTILVQVSIAAVEGSMQITLPVTIINLTPGNTAQLSADNVSVILSGPMPVLNKIKPEDLRVSVDLKGLTAGDHQVAPVVDILPDRVQVDSIDPSVLNVIIAEIPTPTLTPTVTATPEVTPQP